MTYTIGFGNAIRFGNPIGFAAADGGAPDLFGLAPGFVIALAEVLESAEARASNEIPFRACDFPEKWHPRRQHQCHNSK
jgi:hypothetical protein